LQVAALHRRRHHPTVRRGIDWWGRLWVHYRRTCACRVLTATDRHLGIPSRECAARVMRRSDDVAAPLG
jgi:hypothetical protein